MYMMYLRVSYREPGTLVDKDYIETRLERPKQGT